MSITTAALTRKTRENANVDADMRDGTAPLHAAEAKPSTANTRLDRRTDGAIVRTVKGSPWDRISAPEPRWTGPSDENAYFSEGWRLMRGRKAQERTIMVSHTTPSRDWTGWRHTMTFATSRAHRRSPISSSRICWPVVSASSLPEPNVQNGTAPESVRPLRCPVIHKNAFESSRCSEAIGIVTKSAPPSKSRICRYCGLQSGGTSHATSSECVDALQREIAWFRDQLGQRKPNVPLAAGCATASDSARRGTPAAE